jgi:hypothetical protein
MVGESQLFPHIQEVNGFLTWTPKKITALKAEN